MAQQNPRIILHTSFSEFPRYHGAEGFDPGRKIILLLRNSQHPDIDMHRIKIMLPDSFQFSSIIPVRITDINYGGHAGNDTILSLAHEARVQFLKKAGYSELNMEGIGLIITDAGVEYKSELFHGETVYVSVKAANFSKAAFDIFYKLEKENGNERKLS